MEENNKPVEIIAPFPWKYNDYWAKIVDANGLSVCDINASSIEEHDAIKSHILLSTIFTPQEALLIQEIAYDVLQEGAGFDHVSYQLDINPDYLLSLKDKLEKYLNE